MGKLLYTISIKVHKYVGLLIIVYIMYMSISGILLNHPRLIADFSAPSTLTPKSYEIKNWSGGAFRGAVNSVNCPDKIWIYGYNGIWYSADGGDTFSSFMNGEFPKSSYGRKVKDLIVFNKNGKEFLLIGTYEGLYLCDIKSEEWMNISPNSSYEKFVKVYKDKNRLIAISDSSFYVAGPEWEENLKPKFTNVWVNRDIEQSRRSFIHMFLHLHDGSICGFFGKLIVDFTALIIIFLSLSAIYIWYIPKRWKKLKKRGKYPHKKEKKHLNFFYKYHLKLGLWTILFSLIIGFTGLILTPPIIFTFMGKSIKEYKYPSFILAPWKKKIKGGYFDKTTSKLLLSCSDGIWEGDSGLKKEFKKSKLRVPISGMGANVFTKDKKGDLVIGSFSGLYGVKKESGSVYDYMHPDSKLNLNRSRKDRVMVSGFYEAPDGTTIIVSYFKGIIKKCNNSFLMPKELKKAKRSLWNWLFALHNGRIWRSLIGKSYLFVTPIGAIFFILVLFSGLFDYIYRIYRKIKNKK